MSRGRVWAECRGLWKPKSRANEAERAREVTPATNASHRIILNVHWHLWHNLFEYINSMLAWIMTNLTLHLWHLCSKTLHLVVRSALCWRISLPLILHASLPRYSLTATFVLLSFSLYIGPARSQTALQSFILLTCLQLHINYNLNNCLSVRCLFFNRERSEGVCTLTPFNANQKTAYSIFPILLTIVLP